MAGIGDVAELATGKMQGKALDAAKAAGKLDADTEKKIRKSTRITSEDVAAVFDALHELAVDKREVVSVQGHGNYRLVDRKATKARNPQTGKQFDVEASLRFKFTPSKTLREDIGAKKAAGKIPAPKPRAAKAPATAPAATPAAPATP